MIHKCGDDGWMSYVVGDDGVLVDSRNFGQSEASILNITPVRYMLSPFDNKAWTRKTTAHTLWLVHHLLCALTICFVVVLFVWKNDLIHSYMLSHTHICIQPLSMRRHFGSRIHCPHFLFPPAAPQLCTCQGWAVPKPGHEPVVDWGCKHVVA